VAGAGDTLVGAARSRSQNERVTIRKDRDSDLQGEVRLQDRRELSFRFPELSQPHLKTSESRCAMPSDAILHEAQQLHNVSDRLDSLADEHPLVSEALITISGNVRHTATLLEVLVVTKMGPLSGPGPANA
jgi:hypothetical protein